MISTPVNQFYTKLHTLRIHRFYSDEIQNKTCKKFFGVDLATIMICTFILNRELGIKSPLD